MSLTFSNCCNISQLFFNFPLVLEFEVWKHDFERATKSQFVKSTGEKECGGTEKNITTYFYCNRSGHTKNLQLSSKCYKTNTHCTAAIVLSKQTSSTSLFVTVHKSHYGHHCVLGKLRVPTIQRTAIARKLAQGVGVQHIMDEIRSSVGDNLERIHLITRKDIANIERSYGLQGSKRHDDDATSVHLWVIEMEHAGNKNPVIFYKPQGKCLEKTSLLKNDFVLAVQTSLQVDVLKTCGPNKVICIDATHGTNAYDFSLITVVVMDEFGEGYQTSWCLSNRTDLEVVIQFFASIKKKKQVILSLNGL